MHLLVLSPEGSVADVLPGLTLLPAHRTTLAPPHAADLSTTAGEVDAVLLDARARPRGAGELAEAVARLRPGLPTMVVLGADAVLPPADRSAVAGLLLADAGPAEIDARLRLAARQVAPVVLPRPETAPEPAVDAAAGAVVVGDLVVDPDAFTAHLAGRPLDLARREFQLLAALAAHAGRPLTRRALLARVWGPGYDGSARTVDVHVRALRRALGGERERIRTVRGTGYVLLPGTTTTPVPTTASLRTVAAPLHAEHVLAGPSRPARPGGRDAPPDVVASKRAGLPLDLAALDGGPGALGALERYSLKTLGACSQGADELFLVRARTHGRLSAATARALAAIARAHGDGTVHLTTRQQLELHDVPGTEVAGVLRRMREADLETTSTCGHTIRGITVCPDAGVSAAEPFDCSPDAELLTESLLALGPALNTRLPQRFSVSLGGCASCREQAKISDVGLVSVLDDDRGAGYELWVGGSLGRSSPTLATRIDAFVPRAEMLAAVHAVLEVFLAHGAFDTPHRARLKFLVARLGVERFAGLVDEARRADRRSWPAPLPLPGSTASSSGTVPGTSSRTVTGTSSGTVPAGPAPEGGWGTDVRPQTSPGLATVTVTVPLGDLAAEALETLADVCEHDGDGVLRPTCEQNVTIRDVPVERVAALAPTLAAAGLVLRSQRPARDVRACVGAPVCALAITPTQDLARQLWALPSLRRHHGLRLSISGCPASCARHQAADLGFAGNLVWIRGQRVPGFRVHLGGDLGRDRLGRVLGRVAASHVTTLVDTLITTWEELRLGRESLADTVDHVGADVFVSALRGLPALAWEPGDEPAVQARGSSLPLVPAGS